MTLRIGSLCSGYGGLDAAVMAVLPGAEVAWHAQHDPADRHQHAARILEHRFPGVPNHGDITETTWFGAEPVDIMTAGYPCQPISWAGLGRTTDDERWLWPHVARAVRLLRPRLLFLENVAAHVVRGLAGVVADLAEIGYVGSWICLRASDVGAPHQRERLFIVARPAADTDCHALRQQPVPVVGSSDPAEPEHSGGWWGSAVDTDGDALGPECHGQTQGQEADHGRHRVDASGRFLGWGPYTAAVVRWERVTGRPAPSPVDERGRLAPPFVEWMMGLPAGWVTDVPGIPRNAQLKALGNGVVPQQGAAAFRILLDRLTAGDAERSAA